jgi:hypothetical protein
MNRSRNDGSCSHLGYVEMRRDLPRDSPPDAVSVAPWRLLECAFQRQFQCLDSRKLSQIHVNSHEFPNAKVSTRCPQAACCPSFLNLFDTFTGPQPAWNSPFRGCTISVATSQSLSSAQHLSQHLSQHHRAASPLLTCLDLQLFCAD